MKAEHGDSMGWPESERERERYYLLPGMGGRAARRKQKLILHWSLIAGLLVSIILALVIYLLNRPGH